MHGSLRHMIEQRQMEQRLRLDIPTLSDPTVRDLLHESDLFVRSFTGLGFGFGLFSPLDLLRVLSSVAELITQFAVLYSASRIATPTWITGFADGSGRSTTSHLPVLGAIILPTALSFVASLLPQLPFLSSAQYVPSEALYSPTEAREAERAERMRVMANDEHYRAEIQVFGLSEWIISSWSSSRRKILGLETSNMSPGLGMGVSACVRWLLTQTNVSETLVLVQNVSPIIAPLRLS